MAKINTDPDLSVTMHSGKVTEITTIYNNHFIRRVYVGTSYKKAVKKFEEDLKKGKF